MGIIGNKHSDFRTPARRSGGAHVVGFTESMKTHGGIRGRTMSAAFPNQRIAYPIGYLHPYAIDMPIKPGGISTFNQVIGTGALSGTGASGKNAVASLAGTGSLDATGKLVVAAAAAITATGALSGSINAALLASANLSGSGSFTASIGALGGVTAALAGTGTLTAASYATGTLEADIPGEEGALTAGSIAAAVWDALALDNNDAGTMGEKMNDAGSAGDPWSTTVPGAYAEGTAGALMGKLLTTAKFLGLK